MLIKSKLLSVFAVLPVLLLVLTVAFLACKNPSITEEEKEESSATENPSIPDSGGSRVPKGGGAATPALGGLAVISGTYEIGQMLTVTTTNITGGSGSFAFQWKAGGTNTGTNSDNYLIDGQDAGKAISCVITRAGASGSVTTSGGTVKYKLHLDMTGLDAGDSVSFNDSVPLDEVTALSGSVRIYYTLAGGHDTDELKLSFGAVTGAATVSVPATSNFAYMVSGGDALNGVITVYAESVHTDIEVLEPPTVTSFAKDGKVTFTAGANNNTAGCGYTFTLYKDGSPVGTPFEDASITSESIPSGIVSKMQEGNGAYTVKVKAHTSNPLFKSESFDSAASDPVYVYFLTVVFAGEETGERVSVNGLDYTAVRYFLSDTSISLLASPNGSRYVTWSGGVSGTGNTQNITGISLNTTVTATFADPYITIGTQPATTTDVTQGIISGSLGVSASVYPSGTPTYLWYSNTSRSYAGGTLTGVTTASFTIPTSLTLGTYYYYCVVSATGAVSVESDIATVNVALLYTVTFDGNSPTSGSPPGSQTVANGTNITIPSQNTLTKTGYTFGGWNTNSSGAGTNYTAGVTYTVGGNVTLYAKWDVIPNYTVTFDGNSPTSGSPPGSQTVADGTNITIPSQNTLTKTGYTFGGWNTNSSGAGTNYTAGVTYTVGGNVTLYAKWDVIIICTVTFNSMGGSSVAPYTDVIYGSTITAPTEPTSGYGSFVGWYSDIGRTIPFIFGSTNVNGDTTLYAKWNATYNLGDTGPGGGLIFYRIEAGFTVDGYGTPGIGSGFASYTAYYLEAAPNDMASTLAWASSAYYSTNITGTEDTMGKGRKNTAIILATDINAPAAKACNVATFGSKTDWFLPSSIELHYLYILYADNGKGIYGNLTSDTFGYWISWQKAYDSTGCCDFSTNGQFNVISKSLMRSVRAVRAF